MNLGLRDRACIVTGGLGDIGLAVAAWSVDGGAVPVIIR